MDYRVEVEPVAYGLPTLDNLFWNDELHLFEIKSTSAGLDRYDLVLVRKATKDNAPTWNYLNNELKAAQTLTKKFGHVLLQYGRGYVFFGDTPHQLVPVVSFLRSDSHIEVKGLGTLCEEITEGGADLMCSSFCCHCITLGVF
ncbi:hypothetical protein DAEQUDRAFT_770991 [Daedalea quercina L-15889]|uniref:Uncharacterized protein n=1 Tax=Daedalea quercina L-15889 TaxID=1314783 RepID=A0A165KF04_9APHY|nr:hypothetical protein DAEQUDRAFT_770991 [Daedalea quercina L-15889]